MKLRILIVEDELIVAAHIRTVLEKNGHTVFGVARTVSHAQELLKPGSPDMVLLDIYLKGMSTGIDFAIDLNSKNIPFVYISANSSQHILEAAKATGPYGFVVKPFRETDLLVSVDIAWYRHEYKLQQKPSAFANSTNPGIGSATDAGIIGRSEKLNTAIEMAQRVAPTDTSVLILGETGTGKEKIAHYIHHLSNRNGKPFVVVNCSALPSDLIESELFGHEKGAFTNAFEKKIGKFEQANEGTIFLDEIGEMPADLQVKLLRVLQEKELERIGGAATIKINVRIIAATNRVLEKEIAEGRFRPDLYYRLHVFPITMPSLASRKEDIPLLAEHYIRVYTGRLNKDIQGISQTALDKLLSYSWPGNIRELQNIIERTVLLTTGTMIKEVEIPEAGPRSKDNPADRKVPKTMHELEKDHILDVLNYCNYRLTGPGSASDILNISPGTLSAKMKKLGITKSHE